VWEVWPAPGMRGVRGVADRGVGGVRGVADRGVRGVGGVASTWSERCERCGQ